MSADAPQPYAVMLSVAGRLAVVVGSGPGAVRAAKSLITHGADVVIIGPDVSPDLLQMEADGELSLETRVYASGDLDGAFLVIAASGSVDTDAAVAAEARERGVLVSVSSDAAASDFIVPSVVTRGALQIAVTTGGGAPSVAREVRRDIAATFGPEWEAYTRLASELRVLAIEREGLSEAQAGALFERVDGAALRARLAAGKKVTADSVYEQQAQASERDAESAG
jgi:siroheme synthase-like protein